MFWCHFIEWLPAFLGSAPVDVPLSLPPPLLLNESLCLLEYSMWHVYPRRKWEDSAHHLPRQMMFKGAGPDNLIKKGKKWKQNSAIRAENLNFNWGFYKNYIYIWELQYLGCFILGKYDTVLLTSRFKMAVGSPIQIGSWAQIN